MHTLDDIIVQIELHSIEGIRACFAKGVSANAVFRNEPLLYELTSEYTRTPRFKECVKAFVDHGLVFDDGVLLAVLLNDAPALSQHLQHNPAAAFSKYTLRCAYTPLHEASLLHICAELNHVACAEVLVQAGVPVNIAAGIDEHGFGGQTPIFHTVNQNSNNSAAMMQFLLEKSADLKLTVPGLIWGKGYPWETLIPSVNAISYAMMGLLPQMHRDERTTVKTVAILLKQAYGIEYTPRNIPNDYLQN
ncbi:MAG TPA: hypothetical protein VIN08_02940 [Ohtaekwangia sp.]|uniref:hypothetical protein n=1 Tax=Ohtaekwangia sp. TaxID=2066019 RepID=UPI002F959CAA